jgi:hypothetical protein
MEERSLRRPAARPRLPVETAAGLSGMSLTPRSSIHGDTGWLNCQKTQSYLEALELVGQDIQLFAPRLEMRERLLA